MARNGKAETVGDKEDGAKPAAIGSSAVSIAGLGVHTGEDFAKLMSALMSDVIMGTVTPDIANAACNAGGKLLKVVEMQYKYGSKAEERATRPFLLAPQ